MDYADRHPHIARLRLGSILSGAVRLYRVAPGRVAGASLVVLLPLVFVSEGLHELEASLPHGFSHEPVFLFAILPSVSELLALLGLVVLGGVMDELVGATIRGTEQPSIASAARSLPLGRLVAADLVVAVLIGLAAALGALPGLVLAALIGIVGPVVNIERRGPVKAVRRSIRLTWPHLVLAMCIVVPAVVVEGVVHVVLIRIWDALGLAGEIAVEVPLIVTVGAMIVLAEVVLA
ncbi:MAG TPA: hypothetical protein VGH10_12990, partial [Actinomycetota bacterium]